MSDSAGAQSVLPLHLVDGARRLLRRQAVLIAIVVSAVVWVDQTSKAWAWRHRTDVHVNSGGNALSTAQLSAWLRAPASGAVLDIVDSAVLVAAVLVLARVPRPRGVTFSAALMLAGWTSNLLDRLGMHFVTAPGSMRGAIDFLPWNGHYWNLADVAIISGTLALVAAVTVAAVRRLARPAAPPQLHRRPLAAPWARLAMTSGTSVCAVLATFGAVHYGSLSGPL